jgi:hypothetical protein
MAGGFNGEPFEWNVKCIIVSGALTLGYLYLPSKRTDVALMVGFGSYIALAWYDSYDLCEWKLSPNTIISPLTASVKPAVVGGQYVRSY